jgi:hypothetical protein
MVLRVIGLTLVGCVVIKLLAEAVTPMIPVLTVGLVVAVIVAVVFARPRS